MLNRAKKKENTSGKKKKYEKPKCTSEKAFGSFVLGCSFIDCGANSAFK